MPPKKAKRGGPRENAGRSKYIEEFSLACMLKDWASGVNIDGRTVFTKIAG